ncbi:MAG: hypothetical protein NZM25_09170 [Leptospiraceae bacterium]|nr:hypothetical protein [Leptospiraceae bacterium]MDW8307310.1 hypothetical protein [Leptospiraceae bacterium]
MNHKKAGIFFIFVVLARQVLVAQIYEENKALEHYERGLKYMQEKKYKEAEESLRQFLSEEQFAYEVRDALFQLAESLRLQKKYLDAISFYNILRYRYPLNRYQHEIKFRLGQCYYYADNLPKARYFFSEFLKKEATPPQKLHAYLYLGEIEEKSSAFQDALSYYEKAALLYEKDAKLLPQEKASLLYYRLSKLFWEKSKNREAAYHYLSKAFRLGLVYNDEARFLLRKITFEHIDKAQGLIDNSIMDIKPDGDDIYIATAGGGLMRYVRSLGTLEKINLPSDQLRSLHIERDKIYILSFDGIFVYNKKTSQVQSLRTQANEEIQLAQKVIKDDRHLYFTTLTKGLIKQDIFTNKMEILGANSFVGSDQVYALAADHRYLAIGTLDYGVVIQDKKNNKVYRLSRESKHLKGNNIKTLLIDGRFLWIGVHNVGIYRYDLESEKITFFDWHLPFPSAMAKREHEIWIGTMGRGIVMYDQKNERLERFTGIDGLASNDIQCLQVEGNYIWIGYLDQGIDLIYRPLESF